MMQNEICPLCSSHDTFVFRAYSKKSFYKCTSCLGIFKPKQFFLDSEAEKKRYDQHNNDVEDLNYQEFVSPIVRAVLHDFRPEHQGLDFGAGPGPVITKLLRDNHYSIDEYDPFYFNRPELLDGTYDYIVCCEVMEHFYTPFKEFNLLKSLLKPNGKLYCMTDMYHEEINFDHWFYKNDPTHVFFYAKETITWIAEHIGFTNYEIHGRMIIFSR